MARLLSVKCLTHLAVVITLRLTCLNLISRQHSV
ncbi:Uncharacterised protein [Vibrio cholerae]|nr:Uncharacterised protein [Vibrio cholerae]